MYPNPQRLVHEPQQWREIGKNLINRHFASWRLGQVEQQELRIMLGVSFRLKERLQYCVTSAKELKGYALLAQESLGSWRYFTQDIITAYNRKSPQVLLKVVDIWWWSGIHFYTTFILLNWIHLNKDLELPLMFLFLKMSGLISSMYSLTFSGVCTVTPPSKPKLWYSNSFSVQSKLWKISAHLKLLCCTASFYCFLKVSAHNTEVFCLQNTFVFNHPQLVNIYLGVF